MHDFTLAAKRAQMLDGELQNLGLLQLSAVRIPRRRRDQSPELAEGRVDPVAPLLLDHPPPAFPRRVLARVSAGRVASATGISEEGLRNTAANSQDAPRSPFVPDFVRDRREGERTRFNCTLLTSRNAQQLAH